MRARKRWGVLATLVVAGGLMAPTAGSAAAPSPAWQVHALSYPTRFAPGTVGNSSEAPGYVVVAKNIGGAATSGEFTLADELPAGLAPSPEQGPTGSYDASLQSFSMSCGVSGATISCSGDEPVQPGQLVKVVIPVEVEASAPASVTDTATIEGGGAAAVMRTTTTRIGSDAAPFGLLESDGGAYGISTMPDGTTATQAGAHPFQLSVGFNLNDVGAQRVGDTIHAPSGGLRRIEADLPQGVVVNPEATPKCTEEQLASSGGCPDSTQIGTIGLQTSLAAGVTGFPTYPLFNMVTPHGVPGVFAFEILETRVHLIGKVRSDDRYKLSATVDSIPAQIGILGAETTLWGNPSDEAHDPLRGRCAIVGGTCPTDRNQNSFLSLPSSCGGPIATTLRALSWTGEEDAASYLSTDLEGNPAGIDGCNRLDFSPTIESKPTTDQGDSPSGLDFDLHVPQNPDFGGLAEANLKDATVVLPEGMTVNPSAAAGLGACSESQIGLHSEAPQGCPDAAKLGTIEISTPLLDHSLPGAIYLAEPYANPFGSLLALYLAIEDPRSGVVVKLAGKVSPDPTTGRLTAGFAENPELPFEDFKLHFFKGARGTLTTPLTCGAHATTSTLTPWSTPEGADAHPSDSFQTTGTCSSSEAGAPNAPAFSAGTVAPLAGAYSPFSLHLARADGSQRITGIDTTLPEGLTGKLTGIPYCPEAAISVARSREVANQGAVEERSPSCPAASEVGTVNVGAGAGITPYYVTGHAYLAGPYKGAPLSLVVIVPAVAGPFDLGTVVTRVALDVDPYSARIHAVSDPLPTIRDGIPLDVRSIQLRLSRPGFTLNPTSCEAMAIEGSVSTQAGQSAPLKNRFQVGECGRLGFKPKLKIRLKGATRRTGHPALRAVVTYPSKGSYANIARAQVGLPHSEFLDQGNLNRVCRQAQLLSGTCPAKSIYGRAKAWTPLLEKPLEGPVYIGVGFGHKLPDLVADLNGQVRILLHGRVDTTRQKGIRNTFEVVPDAPVSRFVLELKGGKKYGLLENSENICRKKQLASALFTAQNGLVEHLRPRIANSCKHSRRGHHHTKKRGDGGKKRGG